MPWLSLNGLTFELPRDETLVGSGAQARWRIQAVELRPRHFVIDVRDGRARLRPFSAHEVVAVNGRQVPADGVMLNEGDRIAAGSGFFEYSERYPEPRDDVSPLLPPLAYLVDENAGKAYRLQHASTGIGRDPSNLVMVTDVDASRFHAEVRREAGGFALHATGSAGTLLNGHALSGPRLLEAGDQIAVASHTYRFTDGPLPAELSTTLEMVAVNPTVARHPTGTFPTTPQRAGGTGSPESGARIRTVLGVLALLLVLAAALALISR